MLRPNIRVGSVVQCKGTGTDMKLPCLVVRRHLDLVDVTPLAELGMLRMRTVPVTECKLAYEAPTVPYLFCTDEQLALLEDALGFCVDQGYKVDRMDALLEHVQKEQKRRKEQR